MALAKIFGRCDYLEHRPVADEEAWIMLFEPASTLNTGNIENERTLRELERV